MIGAFNWSFSESSFLILLCFFTFLRSEPFSVRFHEKINENTHSYTYGVHPWALTISLIEPYWDWCFGFNAFLVLSMQNSSKLDAEEALGAVFKGGIKPKLISDRLVHFWFVEWLKSNSKKILVFVQPKRRGRVQKPRSLKKEDVGLPPKFFIFL